MGERGVTEIKGGENFKKRRDYHRQKYWGDLPIQTKKEVENQQEDIKASVGPEVIINHTEFVLISSTSTNDLLIQIVFAGLVGIFLTPALANYNINVNHNNSGGSGQQSVSVNNEHNVANVDNNNGWDSWNSVWDYESGFAVTRLFNKKSCIVHKMNKAVMPSLQALDTLVKEKKLQGKGLGKPPSKSLIYTVNPDKVDNLDQFGKSIVAMCKGIPTYMAEEIQAPECREVCREKPQFLGCASAKPCSPQDSKSLLGSRLHSFPWAVLFGLVDNLSNSQPTMARPSTSVHRSQEEVQTAQRAGLQGHPKF
eukprot:bmy_09596T0